MAFRTISVADAESLNGAVYFDWFNFNGKPYGYTNELNSDGTTSAIIIADWSNGVRKEIANFTVGHSSSVYIDPQGRYAFVDQGTDFVSTVGNLTVVDVNPTTSALSLNKVLPVG